MRSVMIAWPRETMLSNSRARAGEPVKRCITESLLYMNKAVSVMAARPER